MCLQALPDGGKRLRMRPPPPVVGGEGVEGVLPALEWVVSPGRLIKWPERGPSTGLAH